MSASICGDMYLEQTPFLRGDDDPEFSERLAAVLDERREQNRHLRLVLIVLAVGVLLGFVCPPLYLRLSKSPEQPRRYGAIMASTFGPLVRN